MVDIRCYPDVRINGIRIGFGYQIDDTMEGLALVGKTLASFGSP